jgi:hypothetical protein
MPEFTENDRQMIQETHDEIINLKTCLLGANHGTNDKGLLGQVQECQKNIVTLFKLHNENKVQLWKLIAILVGSGVMGGGLSRLF